ncbi:AHH domain-containing protein [Aliikangiella sp. IMCC44359]|uniref:AHH domain-containing protein n=1 Tax=Aliikangiella sp. IMCC44359 TaxID=3459125 RepID=UPI00403B083B
MYPYIKPEHTHVEKLLTEFAKIEKPTTADFATLKTRGKVCDYLDRYRLKAMKMSEEQIKAEQHSSKRLAGYMRRAGDPRPSDRCDCHAIISGGRAEAMELRGVLAWLQMRVDDPHNGCWLPRDWEDRKFMPNYLKNGVPHKRIHHHEYYQWLNARINWISVTTPNQLINKLRIVRNALQSGRVPSSVMPKTGLAK